MGPTFSEPQKRFRLFLFLLVLLLCVGLVIVCFLYLNQARHPEDYEVVDLSAWQLTRSDGTAVTADSAGRLDLDAADTLYITGHLADDYSGQVMVSLDSPYADAAILVEGQVAANPSGRFTPGAGFPDPADTAPSSDGLFTLGDAVGREVTLAVQFLTAEPSLSALPQMACYDQLAGYNSQALSAAADAALPAGAFLAVGTILLGIFLLLLWHNHADWSILLLAVAALAFCLSRTVTYSLNAVPQQDALVFQAMAQNLPTLPILWICWIHLTKPLRRVTLVLPLAATVAMVWLLLRGLSDYNAVADAVSLMQRLLLPLAGLLLLLCGIWVAVRVQSWYRLFFLTAGGLLAAAITLVLLAYALTGRWYIPQQQPMSQISALRTFFPLQLRINYLTVFTCFILAFYNFVKIRIKQDSERQALLLQNKFAAEHAGALYRTLLDTRTVRHEIRSRTETLRILCEQGDFQRVKEYVDQFCAQSRIVPSLYTTNMLVNSLIAPRLQTAQDAQVQVSVLIQIPDTLPIPDLDLSTYLTNLLDNAVVAATVCENQPKLLTLRMELMGQRLRIYCRNSYEGEILFRDDGLPRSRSGEWHGYGMSLMRQVAEKYGGHLDLHCENGFFVAATELLLPDG